MALPPEAGAVAGPTPFYADDRIEWAIQQFGSLAGKSVLELGPLEASHTYMLEKLQPAKLQSIEANRLSFLRCLVVKELLGLKLARFYLGDFQPWLEKHHERYDLVIASGVLYHMTEPTRLIELIAARTDAFYLWTHYFSDEALPPHDNRRKAFIGDPAVVETAGLKLRQHKRSYHGAWRDSAFCGGMHDLHHWLDREGILELIAKLGFDDVRVAHDDPAHKNGPSFSIFARRTTPSQTEGQSAEPAIGTPQAQDAPNAPLARDDVDSASGSPHVVAASEPTQPAQTPPEPAREKGLPHGLIRHPPKKRPPTAP